MPFRHHRNELGLLVAITKAGLKRLAADFLVTLDQWANMESK
jgi:hypothetical protein